MWKFGWKMDRDWIRANEKWLILLLGGLIFLLAVFPAGEPARGQAGGAADETGRAGAAYEKRSDRQGGAAGRTGDTEKELRAYEREMEERVRELLRHVEGVGEVDVMITLYSSAQKVLYTDEEKSRQEIQETDSAGGTRKQMQEEVRRNALLAGQSGAGEPVIEMELEPEIAGIVISAGGGESAAVQAEISAAMEALFGLPAHKIKVLKRVE